MQGQSLHGAIFRTVSNAVATRNTADYTAVSRDYRNKGLLAGIEPPSAGWRTAQQVREWALSFCEWVETELAAGQAGEAVTEWLISRGLPSGLSLLEALRDRRSSPSSTTLSTLLLLHQCQKYRELDELVSGCQWEVLQMPGVLPPPVRDLILTRVQPKDQEASC